jgi:hypothetical protein
MSTPREPDLLMFVAGEPDNLANHLYPTFGVGARLASAFVPLLLVTSAMDRERTIASTIKDAWHLPADQVHCVNWVLEAALEDHRYVTIVDVNKGDAPVEFVRQWVGPDEIYPILIRPDGRRLEGFENFDPRALKGFLHRPPPDGAGRAH